VGSSLPLFPIQHSPFYLPRVYPIVSIKVLSVLLVFSLGARPNLLSPSSEASHLTADAPPTNKFSIKRALQILNADLLLAANLFTITIRRYV
jgi:hypothetical protein